MQVNRQAFLSALEAVSGGLAVKETVEQSSCFIFRNGAIQTYNGTVGCRIDYPDIDFEGAVAGQKLLSLLPLLSEEELTITMGVNELKIDGLGRRSGIRCEANISLPELSEFPADDAWYEVPEDFATAIALAVECAKKESKDSFMITCVHVAPDRIEACDNWQIIRFPLQTPIAEPILLRRESIRHIVGLDMVAMGETKTWLHLRNAQGLVYSVQKSYEKYHDMNPFFEFEGHAATLPGGLAEALEKTSVFSSDDKDADMVEVEIRNDHYKVTGRSNSGWYSEVKKAKFAGDPIKFKINPKILAEVSKKHTDVELAPGRMRIKGGRYTYITLLSEVDK